MVKRIGFIDYFLDEWHAEKYPDWISEASGGAMKVTTAYALIDKPGGQSNAEWCEQRGITLLDSIEAVIEQSDYLVVLSPDHPEYHEQLAELPLKSGKPTYIDKTFAPTRAIAQRLFEEAAKHGTPLFSSSALRFAPEYAAIEREGIESVHSLGPGQFSNYSIHQIEPIVALLGSELKRVMYIGTAHSPGLLLEFAGGRQATMHQLGWECPFGLTLHYQSGSGKQARPEQDFFAAFIRQMIAFFETGDAPVRAEETIAIVTAIEYGMQAAETPHQWLELP